MKVKKNKVLKVYGAFKVCFLKFFWGVANKFKFRTYNLKPQAIKILAKQGDLDSILLMGFGCITGSFGFKYNLNQGMEIFETLMICNKKPYTDVAAGYVCHIQGSYKIADFHFRHCLKYNTPLIKFIYISNLYIKMKMEEKCKTIEPAIKSDLIRETIILSEKGFIPATAFIGYRYLDGWGIEPNLDNAIKHLTKSAEAGDGWARIKLGEIYNEGLLNLININKEQAVKWYSLAAQQKMPGAEEEIQKITKMSGNLLAWTPKNKIDIYKAYIVNCNQIYQEDEWFLVNPSYNIFEIYNSSKIKILTINGSEYRKTNLNFHESIVSEKTILLSFWIYGNSLWINCSTLKEANAFIDATNKVNALYDGYKNVLNFTESTMNMLLQNKDELDNYPLLREFVKNDIVK